MVEKKLYMFYQVCLLGLQNFTRNAWLSVAATLVATLAMIFIISGVMLNVTFRHLTINLSQHLKISVYLDENIDVSSFDELEAEFQNHPDVFSVEYTNSQAAKDRFIESHDDPEIRDAFEIASDDVLPQSLEISVSDLNKTEVVAQIALSDKYEGSVDSVSWGKTDARAAIQRTSAIQNNLIRVSIIAAAAFAFVAFMIIFNTIRMAIFSRREEVQIMRLVGASSRYIRWPFIVDAGLYGLLGGLLAASLVYGLIWVFRGNINDVPPLTTSYEFFVKNGLVMAGIFLGSVVLSVTLSVVSCLYALQRYLRF